MSSIKDPTTNGRDYWRSLQERANDPALADSLEHEFAGYNPDEMSGAVPGGVSRRSFVKIMGASMALAGVTATGCRRWPEQKVMPYASRPAGREPNTRQHYASMLSRAGIAQALLVTTFEGRPIKLEGNPQHPISMGKSDALTQASLLEMYDPARKRFVEHDGGRSSWADFAQLISEQLRGTGEGVAILCEANDSPTLIELKRELQAKYNSLTWTTWESLHRDSEIAGTKAAFGAPWRAQYHLDQANIIVSLDADLLGQHPGMLKHARDWAAGRRSADSDHKMNRLYAIESSLTTTGSVADVRIPLRNSEIGSYADLILKGLVSGNTDAKVAGIVADLKQNAGHALVVAGPSQPAEVHELVWQINDAIGAIGKTVTLINEPNYDRDLTTQISELVSQINGGQVKTLIIIGGNPVFDAPAELNFADALQKVETTAHLTLYANETTELCDWQLPRTHDLEAWGDGQSWDGTYCLRQPMIYPLFEGRSEIQLTATLAGHADSDAEKLVRTASDTGDLAWRKNVQRGFIEGSASKQSAIGMTPRAKAVSIRKADTAGFELVFTADASVFDGRHAVNGWMQETPDPLTKLTWDNAALVNIKDARDLGIEHGHLLKITADQKTIEIVAYLMPGQARGTITLPLGYGRTAAGHVGTKVGFNVAPLRTTETQYVATGATIASSGQSYKLATTQDHYLIDWIGDRSIRQRVGKKGESGVLIKEASLDQYIKDKDFANRNKHSDVRLQMYESPMEFNDPHAWGMTIDMATCIGCNACVVACQSENNIPIVGKDQVLVSREMQWLRIDRYFKTDLQADPDAEHPAVVHMPMMCQHCENAPCEEVCPVAATVHDSEGLNTMVYNRCIGTRYCSNNCPYKVRRFNYFDYHAKDSRGMAKPWLGIPDQEQAAALDPIKQMLFNPDVTMRMRGVMEKCSYCTQRIARAKSDARIEQVSVGEHQNRTLADGDVVTACQQSCPTQAIVFGNLNDRHSKVVATQTNDRSYEVLDELNTRPRTKYLAILRNPRNI